MSLVGTTVGRIRITDTLGKGGMGEVYRGYDETLKRQVALKAIRDEQRLDAEAKARFLREARVLSQLDHPGICRIYEFIEEEDSDFLVLEIIEGKSLRNALAEGLDPKSKMHVAEWVAESLVAAHEKGVAHRDLKPENIMLTNDGEVKVLDFGLAYSVDAYASDESAGKTAASDRDASDRDASDRDASDRDAGFEVGDLDSNDLPSLRLPDDDSVAATVLAATADLPAPPKEPPSKEPLARTVFSPDPTVSPSPSATTTLGPSASALDSFVETKQGTVMGTIAYMSPEQARGERASVAGDMYAFGLILQEMFTGRSPHEPGLKLVELLLKVAEGDTLPVTGVDPDLATLITRLKSPAPAARPTAVETAERLQWIHSKPKRRMRRLAAAAVVVALVILGLKYTSDLRRERNDAKQARSEAERALDLMVDMFALSDPDTVRGSSVTVRELLDRNVQKIREEARDQPLVQSRLMFTMGKVYRKLGLYEQALPLLEGALAISRRHRGEEHLETVRYVDNVASLYSELGDYKSPEPLIRSALEIRRKLLGEEHPHVAASLNNLALLHRARGEDDLAEPLFEEALEILVKAHGSDHEDVARTFNNLGQLHRARGDYELAESYLGRAVEIQEKLLGGDHPEFLTSLNNLAIIYHEQGETASAEPLYLRTLAISERVLGTEHPSVASILNNLAELYRSGGDLARAEPLYVRALEIQEEALGESHPSVATSLNNLADLKSATGDDEGAEPLYRRAIEIQERAFGKDHPGVAITLTDLADSYARQGRHEEAEARYLRSLAMIEKLLQEQPDSRLDLNRLAATLVRLGKLYQATGSAEQAAESWNRAADVMGPLTESSDVATFLHTHVLALLLLERVDEARPMVERLLAKGWNRPDFLELCGAHGLL